MKKQFLKGNLLLLSLAALVMTIGLATSQAFAAEGDVLATVDCDPALVGIGFDGIDLYAPEDFTLHQCDVGGAGVLASIPIVGNTDGIVSISWDNGRQVFWGATGDLGSGNRDIYQITRGGIVTFQFTLFAAGFFYTDGLAYDGTDDSIWISGDVSSNIFHYGTDGVLIAGPIPIPNLPGCGNSGIAAGAADILYLGFNGCNTIQRYDKNLNFQSSFLIGTARTSGSNASLVHIASTPRPAKVTLSHS